MLKISICLVSQIHELIMWNWRNNLPVGPATSRRHKHRRCCTYAYA